MSGPSKSTPSPIHAFIPRNDLAFKAGDEVRIGDIVCRAHRILIDRLPLPGPKDSSKKPSTHPQSKQYRSTRFKSPALHLTKGVLETHIVISEELSFSLGRLKFEDPILVYDELSIAKSAVRPIVGILLAAFEARLPPRDTQEWVSGFSVKIENTVELDIVMRRMGPALPEGLALELRGLQSAIEMKTSRSCNTPDIASFSRSAFMNTTPTEEIRDQIGKQGALLKKVHPEQDFVIHALSLAPAHLFPAASNGKRLAIGSDVLGLAGEYPTIVTKPENWLEYIDKVGAFVFAVMYHNDLRISEAWSEGCPDQGQQVQSLIGAAGKALQPTPIEVVLTIFWVAIWAVQRTVSLPFLLLLTRLRWLNLTRRLKHHDVGSMVLDSSSFWRVPLGLTLPSPCSIHETVENIVYVYDRPRIVIKLFTNHKTYANELTCYERLIDLQGRGIPVLHATGVYAEGQRPFLILSNEGKKLDKMSDADKTALQSVVDAIHKKRLHHHDLHPRNVVRDEHGKLSIIDFGYAGECTNTECGDSWKEWWAS